MDLLNLLLDSGNSPALKQVASGFGISETDVTKVLSGVAPALAGGLRNSLSSAGGQAGLLKALADGHHQRYLDQPEILADDATVADGNAILGHILGSKDASRRVASDAAARTGLDDGLLKKMLPVVAALLMGTMSKQSATRGAANTMPSAGDDSGMLGMLTGLLDADKDGSVLDDVINMTRKFL